MTESGVSKYSVLSMEWHEIFVRVMYTGESLKGYQWAQFKKEGGVILCQHKTFFGSNIWSPTFQGNWGTLLSAAETFVDNTIHTIDPKFKEFFSSLEAKPQTVSDDSFVVHMVKYHEEFDILEFKYSTANSPKHKVTVQFRWNENKLQAVKKAFDGNAKYTSWFYTDNGDKGWKKLFDLALNFAHVNHVYTGGFFSGKMPPYSKKAQWPSGMSVSLPNAGNVTVNGAITAYSVAVGTLSTTQSVSLAKGRTIMFTAEEACTILIPKGAKYTVV